MSEEEKKEFLSLKYVRAEREWTQEETERWNHLHKLHSQELLRLLNIMRERRLMLLN